jgi:DNA polymerase-3 subunit epsilon
VETDVPLDVPLIDVPFVVVDLETTGGSPAHCRITEVGAVRIAGGEVQGEFATLVDPGVAIPRSIAALTGITDALVADFPPVEAVLPAFLEFCRGAVLVAHNARFDLGFLNANLERLAYPRLGGPVVCTAALARRMVREEVRDCRLATLAAHFRCATRPVHRALPDARATVEVFHGLLDRAGSFGVLTLEGLLELTRVRDAALYGARRALADGLPHAPGVYAFLSGAGETLYVGKATDLRARVRSYFGADDRRKVVDLLKQAEAIEHVVCPTPVEAAVRELRLLRAHRPRFNARSVQRRPAVYLKLTAERFPRLSIVQAPRTDGATYLGPLPSRRAAQLVADALHDVSPIRRCTLKLGPDPAERPCLLAEIGRCLAPCDGRVGEQGYARAVLAVRAAMAGDPAAALAVLERRIAARAQPHRYEQAAEARDRRDALVAAARRTRRIADLRRAAEVVASRPARGRGADVVVIRGGALVASAACAAAEPEAAALGLAARTRGEPVPAPLPDETDLLARWLDGPGVRVHAVSGLLASRVEGGAALAAAAAARRRDRERAASELDAKRLRREGSLAGLDPSGRT